MEPKGILIPDFSEGPRYIMLRYLTEATASPKAQKLIKEPLRFWSWFVKKHIESGLFDFANPDDDLVTQTYCQVMKKASTTTIRLIRYSLKQGLPYESEIAKNKLEDEESRLDPRLRKTVVLPYGQNLWYLPRYIDSLPPKQVDPKNPDQITIRRVELLEYIKHLLLVPLHHSLRNVRNETLRQLAANNIIKAFYYLFLFSLEEKEKDLLNHLPFMSLFANGVIPLGTKLDKYHYICISALVA